MTGRLFIIKKIVTPGCGFLTKKLQTKTKKMQTLQKNLSGKLYLSINYRSKLQKKNHSVLNVHLNLKKKL